MEEDRIAIYVCPQYAPYMTLEFQEETCRTICKMRELNHLTVFRDLDKSKTVLDKLIEDIRYYRCIVIYSVCCLSDNLQGIIKYLKKITDANVKFISVTDPIDIALFGTDSVCQSNMIMPACIAQALHGHNVWQNVVEFKSQIN